MPRTHVKRRPPPAAQTRPVRESLVPPYAPFGWGYDRFYDAQFGYLGGYGVPADRSQDRTHAPLPYLTETAWRLELALWREMAQRNHLVVGFRDHVSAFVGAVSVQFVRAGGAPGAAASGPADADGDGAPDVHPDVAAATEAWEEFCRVNDWGCGETDREKECRDRGILEGEATLQLFRGGPGEVPRVRHVEPELVRTPTAEPERPGWATTEDWAWGVLTRPDDAETFLALHVHDPSGGPGREVWADRFVRMKCNVDRPVKRGMSDFFCTGELLDKTTDLLGNMVHVAGVQSKVAWWEMFLSATDAQIRAMVEGIRTTIEAGRPVGPFAGPQAGPLPVQDVRRGAIYRTEQRDVKPGPVSEPAGFLAIGERLVQSVGWRFGLPKSFTGEADSFAAALVTGSPLVRMVETRQRKTEGFTRDLVVKVLGLCEESGRLRRGTSARVRPVLTSKPVVIADAEKKARTFLALLDKGCADPAKFMKENEDDPPVLYANLAAHKKKLAEMDASQQPPPPGGGGNPPPAPRDPTPAPPGSAGGDGTSGADWLDGLTEAVLSEAGPGPPPRPGLVWHDGTHRWRDPHSGADHDPAAAPASVRVNTFDPGTAERLPGVLAAILGPHARPHHAADAVGAGAGAAVRIGQARTLEDGTHYVSVTVKTPEGLSANRSLNYDPATGRKWIHNDTLSAEDAQGRGHGTALFARQVAAAAALGFDVIEASGDRAGGKNGYYTLPRWGYDGPIPEKVRAKLPPELAGAETVLDVMATPAGREWWKKNGGPVALTFDLKDGSRSRRVLAAYLAERDNPARPPAPA